MKVLTVLGTRPEIIRLSEIIKLFDRQFEHVLVHTGQNYDYELNQIFFEDLEVRKPDYFLDAAGENASETVGNIIPAIDKILEKEEPDAFVVLGDTNSCLSAYSAKRRKIPVFHLEAGNRCFDARVPEELNRKIIDHMSDINLSYSEESLGNLLREGLPPDRNFIIGTPLYEVFNKHKSKIKESDVLKSLDLAPDGYFLASLHREENVDTPERLKDLMEALDTVSDLYKLPVIVSTHPRTKNNLDKNNISVSESVIFHTPFGFLDYNALQINARCVFSDSGSINEESSILGFKAVNIRYAHERPEASVCGVTPMASSDPEHLVSCTKYILSRNTSPYVPNGYNIIDVSWRVVNHILSMTDYVKRQNFW